MSSLQICHCGWSKMTTYHGLRTHQGKMGCTPKGMGIPENKQYLFKPYIPEFTFTMPPIKIEEPLMNTYNFKPDFSEERPLLGRQRNAGNMGCTLREITMPEFDARKNPKDESRQQDRAPITHTPIAPASLNLPNQTLPDAAVIGIIKSLIENHQHSPPTTANVEETHRSLGFSSGSQPFWMPLSQTCSIQTTSATPEPATKETNTTLFETPQRSHQPAAGFNKNRRVLDFSTGAQQMADMSWMIPTTTPQENVLQPQVKEKETDREAEKVLQFKAKKDKIIADLLQKIQTKEHKVAEVKSSVKACKGGLDAEWLEINDVFSEVIKIVEDARQKALQPVEDRRQRVKREARNLVTKLQEEINRLKRNMDEVEKSSDLEMIKTMDGCRDWTSVSVDTSFSFGTLRTTTTTMMEEIHQKLDKLSSVELKRISTFAVDVKMDPTTAHPCLVVSQDGKKVQDGGKNQQVPNTPGRFDEFGSILGLGGFTHGKSYWEVEVKNKSGWDLGVARGKSNRKGKLTLNPDQGY
ncbi:uncharacterized protein LOC115438560 [Sphaeramia orbicularis]|uniref:Uncharacterized LOC115438560 n=1 Tax=Sphaeramia orbicularis TaxID=375764 RepID=A0A673CIF6_9TELE|nr:uncharacterized protein LOC115438560 [Sphaeramia orbicularis]